MSCLFIFYNTVNGAMSLQIVQKTADLKTKVEIFFFELAAATKNSLKIWLREACVPSLYALLCGHQLKMTEDRMCQTFHLITCFRSFGIWQKSRAS